MASIREIKRRKNSVSNTQQITKAMKLVSTAKLQKAKQGAELTRPYFYSTHKTISSILASCSGISHPVLEKREGNRDLYIVVTSNRGLAGGYNNNIGKLVKETSNDGAKIIAIGKKGADYLAKRGFKITESYNEMINTPNYVDAMTLGTKVLQMFLDDEIDNIFLVYTHFQSTLVQEPKLMKIIPIDANEFDEEVVSDSLMQFEPSAEEVLDSLMPKYVSSLIYGALKESSASEQGARMTAMDSATNNAQEMIEKLSLKYNRARQAAITQEITEIVGGAGALEG